MTQNEKDLLLKDLCSRLPYGVKVEYENEIFDVEYVCPMYEEVKFDIPEAWTIGVSEVKPYLFPLSSMTEEQMHDFFCRFVVNEIDYIDFKHYYVEQNRWNKIFTTISDCFEVVTWFIKNHFDVYGLIPIGLANDATGLNIY